MLFRRILRHCFPTNILLRHLFCVEISKEKTDPLRLTFCGVRDCKHRRYRPPTIRPAALATFPDPVTTNIHIWQPLLGQLCRNVVRYVLPFHLLLVYLLQSYKCLFCRQSIMTRGLDNLALKNPYRITVMGKTWKRQYANISFVWPMSQFVCKHFTFKDLLVSCPFYKQKAWKQGWE